MGIISCLPLGLRWFVCVGCILVPFLQLNSQLCQKNKKQKNKTKLGEANICVIFLLEISHMHAYHATLPLHVIMV
jgi:hypothetical protein